MKSKLNLRLLIAIGAIMLVACAPAATATTTTTNNTNPTVSESAGTKINLNTATSDQLLTTIPGFGNRMVREFQEYSPYISIQQFRQEIGKYVDDTQIAEYEKYVYVPIAINDSDSATLQQIPGLDSTEADSVIASRPYASTDAFLTELSEFVSAAELETAKAYLGNNE
jgi:DNA uptake protein ComE-like DNA-binding protein